MSAAGAAAAATAGASGTVARATGSSTTAGRSASDAGRAGANAAPTPGREGSGGTPASSAAGRSATAGSTATAAAGAGGSAAEATGEAFSFFVASLEAMRKLSGSQDGFGGDLRFGETGDGAGLRGADKICSTMAEQSLPGAGKKTWRAFLSATKGGASGGPVHAIERIGNGPWYDRLGRLVAMDKQQLLGTRPTNADAAIKNDLPNESGTPNHDPDGSGEVDNHDVLTGTNAMGMLAANDPKLTCNDWTKAERDPADMPQVGHSWGRDFGGGGPRGGAVSGSASNGGYNGAAWIESHGAPGCGPGVGLVDTGFPDESDPTVGGGGGYGAIYCFALTP